MSPANIRMVGGAGEYWVIPPKHKVDKLTTLWHGELFCVNLE